jgi:hypothetical protein
LDIGKGFDAFSVAEFVLCCFFEGVGTLCKIYNFEKLAELQRIMNQIDGVRARLEDEYVKAGRVTREIMDMEQRIDGLVVHYMRVADKVASS